MKKWAHLFCLFILISSLSSCEEGFVINESHSFSDTGWPMKQKVIFPFEIKDSLTSYDLSVSIRQSNDYPFHNFYFLTKIMNQKGQTIKQGLAEAFFYDPKSGKSIGQSSGSIIGHKYLILKHIKFPRNEKYIVQLEQYMRKDTIPGIVSIGASIAPIDENNGKNR
ncbi:MAG: gliding motility lipoprotein GldH [Aquirufa sp.]